MQRLFMKIKLINNYNGIRISLKATHMSFTGNSFLFSGHKFHSPTWRVSDCLLFLVLLPGERSRVILNVKNLTLVLNIYRFSCVFVFIILLFCSRTNIQPMDRSSFSVQIYRQTSALKGEGRSLHLAEFLFGIGYGWVCYCFRLFMRYECP